MVTTACSYLLTSHSHKTVQTYKQTNRKKKCPVSFNSSILESINMKRLEFGISEICLMALGTSLRVSYYSFMMCAIHNRAIVANG